MGRQNIVDEQKKDEIIPKLQEKYASAKIVANDFDISKVENWFGFCGFFGFFWQKNRIIFEMFGFIFSLVREKNYIYTIYFVFIFYQNQANQIHINIILINCNNSLHFQIPNL